MLVPFVNEKADEGISVARKLLHILPLIPKNNRIMSLLHLVHKFVVIKFAEAARDQFNPEVSYAFRLTVLMPWLSSNPGFKAGWPSRA